MARLEQNVLGLVNRDRVVLERWRRGMALSVGGVLLDDLERLAQTEGRDD